MSRKGENIYKRKDGRWEGRYTRCYDAAGKAKYGYVYGKSYNDVKDTLIQKKADSIRHPTAGSLKAVAYNDILDAWLRASKLKTKESTHARYAQLVGTHVKPHLGGYQLSRISTQQVERFVEYLLSEGRLDGNGGLSPKTVIDILTITKNTMEYARYQNMPVACNLGKMTVKGQEKEMRVLTPKEQDALVAILVHKMDRYKFGVLELENFVPCSGEILVLTWLLSRSGRRCSESKIWMLHLAAKPKSLLQNPRANAPSGRYHHLLFRWKSLSLFRLGIDDQPPIRYAAFCPVLSTGI